MVKETLPEEQGDAAERQAGILKCFGGSQADTWNAALANQLVAALWRKPEGTARDNQVKGAVGGLAGISPQDEMEGMLAVQMIAAHSAAMECYRRAMIPEQSTDGRAENLNHANKLSRTYSTLLEALNRHRGKGQQKVTVEHVHVHAGGQAIVGHIERGAGVDEKSERQPHAQQQIAHASEPPVRSADTSVDAVPVSRYAERSVPDARRKVARSA
jgi:hypothetical protein